MAKRRSRRGSKRRSRRSHRNKWGGNKGDLRLSAKRDYTGRRRKSRKRSRNAKRAGGGLTLWRKALKKHGYGKKGAFKKFPKKGTKAYKAVKRTYNSLKK